MQWDEERDLSFFNENINVLISHMSNAWHLMVVEICWYVAEHTHTSEMPILCSVGWSSSVPNMLFGSEFAARWISKRELSGAFSAQRRS